MTPEELTKEFNRIDTWTANGQFATALARIDNLLKAEKTPKTQAKLLCAAARCEAKQKRFGSARTLLEKAEALDPQNLKATIAIIRTHLEENDIQGALRKWENEKKALESQESQNKEAWAKLPSLQPGESQNMVPLKSWKDLTFLTANTFLENGYHQEAETLFALLPGSDRDNPRRAVKTALLLENQGKLEEARKSLEEAIANSLSNRARTAAVAPYLRVCSKLGQNPNLALLSKEAAKTKDTNTKTALAQNLRRSDPTGKSWQEAAISAARMDGPNALAALMLLASDPQTQESIREEAFKTLLSQNPEPETLVFCAKRLPQTPWAQTLWATIEEKNRGLAPEKQAEVFRARAEGLSQNNENEAASAMLALALTLIPKESDLFTRTHWRAAQNAKKIGDNTAASTHLIEIVNSTTTQPRFRIQSLLEWAGLQTENPEAAAAEAQKRIERLAQDISDPQTLLDASRQVLTSSPTLKPLALEIYKSGSKKALAEIEKTQETHQKVEKAFLLARRQADFLDSEATVDLWEKTLRGLHEKAQRSPSFPDLIYYVAQAYWIYGDPNEAKSLTEKSLRNPQVGQAAKAALLALDGYHRLKQGENPKEALAKLTEATKEAPSSAHAARGYYWLCLHALHQGKTQESKEIAKTLERTLQLNPGNQFLWQESLRENAKSLIDVAQGKIKESELPKEIQNDLKMFQNTGGLSFFRRSRSITQAGFGLMETVLVILVIGLVITFGAIALNTTRSDAAATQTAANAKILNDASIRAQVRNLSGPGTTGFDKTAAYNWYVQLNLIEEPRPLNLDPLFYVMGTWGVSSITDDPSTWAARIAAGEYTDQQIFEILGRASETNADIINALVGSPNLSLHNANTLSTLLYDGTQATHNRPWGMSHDNNLLALLELGSNPNLPEGTILKWNDIDMSGVNGSAIEDINLAGNDLSGSEFSGRWLEDLNWAGSDLTNTSFLKANVSGGDMSNAILTNADFEGADLRGTDLTGADLTNVNFSKAKISDTNNLTNEQIESVARLDGTRFGANFHLENTNLSNRNLTGTIFLGDIEGVNFSNSNLTDARFNGNIEGINLTGANINRLILGRDENEDFIVYYAIEGKATFQQKLDLVQVGSRGKPAYWIDGTVF